MIDGYKYVVEHPKGSHVYGESDWPFVDVKEYLDMLEDIIDVDDVESIKSLMLTASAPVVFACSLMNIAFKPVADMYPDGEQFKVMLKLVGDDENQVFYSNDLSVTVGTDESGHRWTEVDISELMSNLPNPAMLEMSEEDMDAVCVLYPQTREQAPIWEGMSKMDMERLVGITMFMVQTFIDMVMENQV